MALKELSLLPSVLCIHGIQVLGLDDPREQVVPKAEQRGGVSPALNLVYAVLGFVSAPKLLGEFGQAEGDTKWGTAKPTNPASKHSD